MSDIEKRDGLNMPTDREWYERKAKVEGDLEISAGRRSRTMVGPNATADDTAALERLAIEALPQWARDRIEALEAELAEAKAAKKLAVEIMAPWAKRVGKPTYSTKNGFAPMADFVAKHGKEDV